MTSATSSQHSAAIAGQPVARVRDPRLDFFRGITMFIILIAHTPGNWLTLWIPARFGFSDATEVFVFLSGMASAIAFGAVFRDQGLLMGAARVAFRCWQVYWAHIALFFAIAATMVFLNDYELGTRDYVGQLNLHPFFKDTMVNLPALMTLTYVPNYFDILPMYLVVLAMMPIVIGLHRLSPFAALAFVWVVWIGSNSAVVGQMLDWLNLAVGAETAYAKSFANLLALPAEPWSNREWFFNPFGWQLIFYTGFALMSGWIPAPPINKWLIALAIAVLLFNFALSHIAIRAIERDWITLPAEGNPVIRTRIAMKVWISKTDFGILRYTHFLAIGYLAFILVGPKGVRLLPSDGTAMLTRLWRRVLAIIMKVGQQSLAVFITSMYLARLMGLALDNLGKTYATQTLVNVVGFAVLIAAAYGAGWFKSQPWKKRRNA